jgi:hypothetical protein
MKCFKKPKNERRLILTIKYPYVHHSFVLPISTEKPSMENIT